MSHVQALRAYAATAVVLYHLSVRSSSVLGRSLWPRELGWGASGVDTFFVLSGFIILTVHRRDISRRSRLKPYVTKRAIRIYPIYWLITLIALPVYFGGYGSDTKRTADVIFRSITLIPQHPGTFPIVNVAWTLSFEIFFYLVFGLVIAVPLRWGIVAVMAWLVPCFIVFVLGVSGAWHPSRGLMWIFLFSPRNLEFALGGLVAVVGPLITLPRPRLWLLGALAAIVSVAALGVHPNSVAYPTVSLTALPSAIMLLAASQLDHEGELAPRFLEALGDASYSLYLVHFGVLTGVFIALNHLHVVNGVTWPACLVLAFLTAVGVALVSYRFVERPVLRRARGRLVREPAPTLSAGGTI